MQHFLYTQSKLALGEWFHTIHGHNSGTVNLWYQLIIEHGRTNLP